MPQVQPQSADRLASRRSIPADRETQDESRSVQVEQRNPRSAPTTEVAAWSTGLSLL